MCHQTLDMNSIVYLAIERDKMLNNQRWFFDTKYIFILYHSKYILEEFFFHLIIIIDWLTSGLYTIRVHFQFPSVILKWFTSNGNFVHE